MALVASVVTVTQWDQWVVGVTLTLEDAFANQELVGPNATIV